MQGKRVVVTGGAGFIGSHLAESLAEQNTVIILDDLSTGNQQNVAALLNFPNVTLVRESVLNLAFLKDIFAGVDYVFHEAALPSVPRSISDPISSNAVNVTGTLNVLLAARDSHVAKVVAASSSSVYGDTPTLPKQENMPPKPLSPYALTKLTAEHYCRLFTDLYNLPTVCLRYFNVYGPRQNIDSQYAAVVPRFIRQALRGRPLEIFGDGEQTRDLTFVCDVVRANIQVAESTVCGVFNIGTGERVSINTLAEMILRLTENHGDIKHTAPRVGDIKHSLADISRAKGFGYEPRYSLEAGLQETIGRFGNVQ
jgi:UDP-glucose 4-epimerase